MRIKTIEARKQQIRNEVEVVSNDVRGVEDLQHFHIGHNQSFRRRASDFIGPTLLKMKDRKNRELAAVEFPFHVDQVSIGYRYVQATFNRVQSRLKPINDIKSVLIEGCWLGDFEAQKWLKLGVKNVSGVEIVNMSECWKTTVPALEKQYGIKPDFRHGTVENLPFDSNSFDLVTSTAVYEHVYDLDKAMGEVARVLKPGGLTSHSIGPLYYSTGGDHCSTNYEHLMLEDNEYKRLINDDDFFSKQPDPNCRNWALSDKFSFATAKEYMACIQRHLKLEYVLVVISPDAIQFRQQRPKDWANLIAAGVPALDLLTVSLYIHARKK